MSIKTIAVIGAGNMGSGIAQVAACSGYQVILSDLKEDFINRGLVGIKKNVEKLASKGKLNDSPETIMDRFTTTSNLAEIKDVDLVFEVIIENMEKKKELYKEIDEICKPETIFCSNTSGLSITEMASATKRPDKVIGTHFFNPVPVMELVEIIRGNDTSEETYLIAKDLCQSFGKTLITVNEAPLFAVNRILAPMINEAIFVLQDGVASAEDIDLGMKLGANHPIGPLALADLIGLDVLLTALDTLYVETADSKFRPATLLRKLVRAGHYGRKTGRGFYEYG
ncbi:3-hydroxyacyl-CoA dehydrogenase NAD-binding domain-containing protein [Bacillus sp. B15-48]|uniref:3-hydroxyacyl-CoA dehydrogenase NAD-binding domain-containing protein n=1 Tax=Bacillus sp. B15-48 TaxID=1548601 RepID=UPI00193F4C08|nr:3-hydroxyacyl-CoA dehydrogenase NAD-binding domain-containing protein [Bacillus sp. B15-48]